jgi:D-aminopeptidase
VTGPPAPRGPRLRELGLRIGGFASGADNAITDVAGVEVGHVTVWRDEPEGRGIARTGVTAILPGSVAGLFRAPVPAGAAVLNGAGEMTGFVAVSEWGLIETPVYLTSTMAVGRVFDGAVAAAVAVDPAVGTEDVVIPVVAECDDSRLSDSAVVQVDAADAGRALAAARRGPVAEGAVGAGTGMVCFDWKGGIGTASRVVPEAGATVGVLVLANFGSAPDLRVDGVPVGRLLPAPEELVSRPQAAASRSWRLTRRSPPSSSRGWPGAPGLASAARARSRTTAAARSSSRSPPPAAARAPRPAAAVRRTRSPTRT